MFVVYFSYICELDEMDGSWGYIELGLFQSMSLQLFGSIIVHVDIHDMGLKRLVSLYDFLLIFIAFLLLI